MLLKFFGGILILDGILSLFLPLDKKFLWQLGRLVRIFIGICLILYK